MTIIIIITILIIIISLYWYHQTQHDRKVRKQIPSIKNNATIVTQTWGYAWRPWW